MSSKRSKEVGSVSVAEVELLRPYWWLLSPAQRAKEQEFLAAAVKKANDAGRTSGAASSSGAKDKAPTYRGQAKRGLTKGTATQEGEAEKRATIMKLSR